ncbi:hypothetical protein RJT34_13885 [Clitoria ternatea]|uniref:Uncharacterized protein n=1 Tax=Clitoria ternatea TaxID=43366 RepID=A0AAN9JRW3_CLITE
MKKTKSLEIQSLVFSSSSVSYITHTRIRLNFFFLKFLSQFPSSSVLLNPFNIQTNPFTLAYNSIINNDNKLFHTYSFFSCVCSEVLFSEKIPQI